MKPAFHQRTAHFHPWLWLSRESATLLREEELGPYRARFYRVRDRFSDEEEMLSVDVPGDGPVLCVLYHGRFQDYPPSPVELYVRDRQIILRPRREVRDSAAHFETYALQVARQYLGLES